jgi:hypothetical protein
MRCLCEKETKESDKNRNKEDQKRQKGDESEKASRKFKKKKRTYDIKMYRNVGNGVLLVSAWGAENPECAKCHF